MSIANISNLFKPIAPIAPNVTEAPKPVQPGQKTSFSEMFGNAIHEVEKLQTQANGQIQDMVLDKGNVTPHDAMIALEKADVAFQLMTQVRTKIINAYQEVMRTQV
jgi:flagellar hook-basal body complex protein FliE